MHTCFQKILGCGKFKEKGLQNEDELKVMFEDLRNTGDDHFCASSGVIPQSPNGGSNGGDEEAESDDDNEPEEITPSGRSGTSTQNVMAVVDFDMRFTYASIGQPGSMHDTSVLYHAIEHDTQAFPHPPLGKIYCYLPSLYFLLLSHLLISFMFIQENIMLSMLVTQIDQVT